MQIDTTRFGTLEIIESDIIKFDEGLPGLEDQQKFIFIEPDEATPLVWMQSVTDPYIALPVINPFIVNDEYTLDIRDNELEALDIKEPGDIALWVVAVIPEDITRMTVNLAAPVIVNGRAGVGKQLVSDIREYDARYPAFAKLVEYLEGASDDAGTVEKD